MPSTKDTETSTSTAAEEAAPYSAEIIASNDDLLNEIHVRLPIKSLIKFQCVSKHWLSRISHLKLSLLRRPPAALFLPNRDNEGEYDFIDLNPDHPPSRPASLSLPLGLNILHSCNGLFLCDDSHSEYYVLNPTTRRYDAIPPLPLPGGHTSCNLAFDPSRSPHYKLVCVRNRTGDPSEHFIEIYSSETGEWRLSSCGEIDNGWGIDYSQGVFWNGSLIWIATAWGWSFRFDVESEGTFFDMRKVPMPDNAEVEVQWSRRYLVESGGHLHFVYYLLEPGQARFNVYEMERDFSWWFVKYDVDVSEMVLGSDECMLSVLSVIRCEVEEDSFLVMNVSGRVFRYNLKSGSFRKLCDIRIEDDPEMCWDSSKVYPYIESLACVGHDFVN